MGQALYRKYRSRSLDEIVGQEHVTTTLKNALKTGKISHAYLLTGPRGTGKTSIARILAHEINDLPYSEEAHFDIIEIDAASNNGVEDVRALREKVQSAPTSAKYKVYIIDEVHMLSKAAFNALLKTLEEPPEHVVFILATTEVHKLPETIISRTQRYSFRPVPLEQVVEHLKDIASSENITVDDEALRLIAEHGEGSFRDSISLLDQASTLGGTITVANVEQLLGRAPTVLIDELLTQLSMRDTTEVTSTLRELYDKGYEPAMISVQLSKRLRSQLGTPDSKLSVSDSMALLLQLLAVPASHRPGQLLELTLLSYALIESTTHSPNAKQAETSTAPQPKPAQPNETQSQTTEPDSKPAVIAAKTKAKDEIPSTEQVPPYSDADVPKNQKPLTVVTTDAQKTAEPALQGATKITDTQESSLDDVELWQEVLQAIKQTHNTLYGIARMAKPVFAGDTLTLTTKFPFHQKRLSETKNRDILTACVTKLRGSKTTVKCTVSETSGITGTTKPTGKADVSVISSIFGGAELLD